MGSQFVRYGAAAQLARQKYQYIAQRYVARGFAASHARMAASHAPRLHLAAQTQRGGLFASLRYKLRGCYILCKSGYMALYGLFNAGVGKIGSFIYLHL